MLKPNLSNPAVRGVSVQTIFVPSAASLTESKYTNFPVGTTAYVSNAETGEVNLHRLTLEKTWVKLLPTVALFNDFTLYDGNDAPEFIIPANAFNQVGDKITITVRGSHDPSIVFAHVGLDMENELTLGAFNDVEAGGNWLLESNITYITGDKFSCVTTFKVNNVLVDQRIFTDTFATSSNQNLILTVFANDPTYNIIKHVSVNLHPIA